MPAPPSPLLGRQDLPNTPRPCRRPNTAPPASPGGSHARHGPLTDQRQHRGRRPASAMPPPCRERIGDLRTEQRMQWTRHAPQSPVTERGFFCFHQFKRALLCLTFIQRSVTLLRSNLLHRVYLTFILKFIDIMVISSISL